MRETEPDVMNLASARWGREGCRDRNYIQIHLPLLIRLLSYPVNIR